MSFYLYKNQVVELDDTGLYVDSLVGRVNLEDYEELPDPKGPGPHIFDLSLKKWVQIED